MLDVRPLYCLTWPGLVPFHCPLILLVSLVGISQFSFQLLRILENVVSVAGRDGSLVDCTRIHEELVMQLGIWISR